MRSAVFVFSFLFFNACKKGPVTTEAAAAIKISNIEAQINCSSSQVAECNDNVAGSVAWLFISKYGCSQLENPDNTTVAWQQQFFSCGTLASSMSPMCRSTGFSDLLPGPSAATTIQSGTHCVMGMLDLNTDGAPSTGDAVCYTDFNFKEANTLYQIDLNQCVLYSD
jgi:hypothetical protein